jgi:hypothetical protein
MIELLTTEDVAKRLHRSSRWLQDFLRLTVGVDVDEEVSARRGRVQELQGTFLHFLHRVRRHSSFGYGVNTRPGRIGHWYCAVRRSRGGAS